MMKIAGKSTSRPPTFFRNLNLVIHIAVHTHARFLPHNFIQFGVILFSMFFSLYSTKLSAPNSLVETPIIFSTPPNFYGIPLIKFTN